MMALIPESIPEENILKLCAAIIEATAEDMLKSCENLKSLRMMSMPKSRDVRERHLDKLVAAETEVRLLEKWFYSGKFDLYSQGMDGQYIADGIIKRIFGSYKNYDPDKKGGPYGN